MSMSTRYVYNPRFMKAACHAARMGIRNQAGGPFGSVIVKDGRAVGIGYNQVLEHHDPTCHGEIQAIRDACRELGTHDLSGCVLYTTAEPCPMCLAACVWAHISCIYYGCSLADTDALGFQDKNMNYIFQTDRNAPEFVAWMHQEGVDMCKSVFEEYATSQHTIY